MATGWGQIQGAPTSDSGSTRRRFTRIAVGVCDSVGCGEAPDGEEHVRTGRAVFRIGKIHDIFAGRGLDAHHETADNREGIEATIRALRDAAGDLILTNLVDFDSEYGHRNDPAGYAAALEELDRELPRLLQALPPEGCLMLTADHGNDPTAPGTDHTRECVPLLVTGPGVAAIDLGTRESFADLGMTVLEGLGVPPPGPGRSFLDRL